MTQGQKKRLFSAIENNQPAQVGKLVEDDPSALETLGIGKKAMEGKTPLMYALQCANAEIAHLLVDRGANIHAVMAEEWGWPVLHFAVRAAIFSNRKKKHIAFLERLLSLGADPNRTDAFGNTSLDRALMDYHLAYDHWDIVYILLKAGADPDHRQPSLNSAIRERVRGNKHRYSERLLELFGFEKNDEQAR